jgi:DNA-binding winged helix-turn-helix (wHTH) protein/tetratricopeptide (TPR) repeat protein
VVETVKPIAFPPFELDAVNQRLRRNNELLTLRPKAFAVLAFLVQNAGQLVTKDQLLEACWAGTAVTDTVLKVCIREIREALGDDPRSPRFIETAHRRGYRFVGEIVTPITTSARPFSGPPTRWSGDDASGQIQANRPVAERQTRRPRDSGRLKLIPPLPDFPPPTLVGRERALAQLKMFLDRALSGTRQVVFVTGEAGIGKTSLVETFLHEIPSNAGTWVGRGQCLEQYGSGEAYFPVLEAISRLSQDHRAQGFVELLRRHAPTWLQQLPWLLDDEAWESLQRAVIGATRERMLREMAEALESLTTATSLIFVLEDLHWGDYSTLDLVSYLARRSAPARLMLIATYRPVDVAVSDHPLKSLKPDLRAHRKCEEIALEYLGTGAVNDYLGARFKEHELPRELGELLHQRTDGNPFFLVNAVDYLQAEGLIAKPNSHWRLTVPLGALEVGVPESIRQMIEKQIERVNGEQRRMLEVAAVAGLEFSTGAVAAGLEQDLMRVEEHCEQLARQHLFLRATGTSTYEDGTVTARYAFIHALYQEVLYQRVTAGRRASLHRVIGERGEELYGSRAGEVAAELAMHFEQGHDYGRAVKYLRQAAQNHFQRYANREAIAYLGRVLRLVERLPREEQAAAHMSALEQAALARRAMGDMDGAAADLEALAEYAGEQGRKNDRVRALTQLATALSWVDRERCLSAARQSMSLGDDITDELLKSEVRSGWGYWHVLFLGWEDDHMDSIANAVAAARVAGNREMLGLHLARYSFLECLQSGYRSAALTAEEAAQVALQTSDAHSYLLAQFFEAWALLHGGQWGQMRRILDHGLEMAERNQHTRWAVLFLLELGWLHEQAFDFEVAVQMCKAAVEQARAIQHPYTESLGLILLGLAYLGLQKYDDALGCLIEVDQRMKRERILMDWILQIVLHYALSRCRLAQGNALEARREAELVRELAEPPGERTYLALAHLLIAETAMNDADWNEADAAVERAINVTAGADAPMAEWRVWAVAARLNELRGFSGEATDQWQRSLQGLNRLADSLEKSDRLHDSILGAAVFQNIRRASSAAPGKD